MLSRSARGTPFFSAIAEASAIASIAAVSRKLPASLTTFAAPTSSPKSKTPCPMASNNGFAASFDAAAPDAQIHSFFAAAASGRPNTGAATNLPPNCAWRSDKVREVTGETVLIETCRPVPSIWQNSSFATSSSARSSASTVTTVPPGTTASTGVCTATAPFATSPAAFSAVRL